MYAVFPRVVLAILEFYPVFFGVNAVDAGDLFSIFELHTGDTAKCTRRDGPSHEGGNLYRSSSPLYLRSDRQVIRKLQNPPRLQR